ncbi:hypothetical protein ACIRPU_02085 [Streptomyces sp. NPDC102259]|uniref:hypothetical protein n=1 Tax=Streptomyces sp. NPDC102259 TaxID=3366148 RepID=UPI00380D1CB8
MTVTLTSESNGQVSLISEAARGDNATEALADLLMGPGGVGGRPLLPELIAVVVRRGIDVMWIAQPPIHVEAGDKEGEWKIGVPEDGDDVTVFSAPQARDLLARLQAEYGAR